MILKTSKAATKKGLFVPALIWLTVVKSKNVPATLFCVGNADDCKRVFICHFSAHCQRRGHCITTVDQSDMLGSEPNELASSWSCLYLDAGIRQMPVQ